MKNVIVLELKLLLEKIIDLNIIYLIQEMKKKYIQKKKKKNLKGRIKEQKQYYMNLKDYLI